VASADSHAPHRECANKLGAEQSESERKSISFLKKRNKKLLPVG
jgi:hypothetical protein